MPTQKCMFPHRIQPELQFPILAVWIICGAAQNKNGRLDLMVPPAEAPLCPVAGVQGAGSHFRTHAWAPTPAASSVVPWVSPGTVPQRKALSEVSHHGRHRILTSLSIKEFLRARTVSLSSVTESLQPLRNSRSSLYSNWNRRKAEEEAGIWLHL